MKSAVELLLTLIYSTIIKIFFVMLGGYSRKFSRRQCKIQLSGGNLREQKFLLESLKPKILATMVPPPGYAGYITNLRFWATGRLERMRVRGVDKHKEESVFKVNGGGDYNVEG